MSYKLVYLPSFVDDMRLIVAYLSLSSSKTAGKFADEVEKQAMSLTSFPKRFASYEANPVFRRLITLYDYQVFYVINEEKKLVQVHHVLHGHRDILRFLNSGLL